MILRFFSCRVINHFIHYSILQYRKHDLPGPSFTVVAEETVNDVSDYSKKKSKYLRS